MAAALLLLTLLGIGAGLWRLCHYGSHLAADARDRRRREVQLQRLTYAAVMQMLGEVRRASGQASDERR